MNREEYLRAVLEVQTDMIVTADRDGRIVEFNRGAERILGYGRDEMRGKHVRRLFHNRKKYEELMRRFRRIGEVADARVLGRHKSGKPVEISMTLSKLAPDGKEVIGTICIGRDITRRRDLERELLAKTRYLESVLDHSATMIVTADRKGKVLEFNPAAERTLGYRREEVIGRYAGMFYLKREERDLLMRRVLRTGQVVDYETKLVAKDRSVVDVAITMSRLLDHRDRWIGTVSMSRDITQRKRLETELERLVVTDDLTGLFNRRHFFEQFRSEIRRSRRVEYPLSLVLVDVDGFKGLNDTEGHAAGDDALRSLAKIVDRSIRREVDSGYRMGGDEFVLLLPNADAGQALLIAERVRRRYKRRGFGKTSLSIGIAECAERDGPRRLIERADRAMYAAKEAGGNRSEVH